MGGDKQEATGPAANKSEQDEEFQQGLKLIKERNWSQASNLLSAVLERFVSAYGELAPECADVYMQYGVALLREVEQREENADVLGDCVPREIATKAAPEEKGKSEGEGEGSSSAAAPDAGDQEEGEGDEDGGEEDGEEDEGESEDEGEGEGDGEGKGDAKAAGNAQSEGGGGEGSATADDTDDLQIAFEVLDCARIIMTKEDDMSQKLGDVYSYLGDVNLRNEQFEEALADYTSSLKIREETCLKDDDRIIESHQQIATAYQMVAGQKQNALAALREALESCELRRTNLRTMLAGEEETVQPPEGSSLKPMTKPEIDAKLIEVEEICEEFRARIESEEVPDGTEGGASGSSSSGAAASLGLDAVKALAEQSGLMGAPAAGGSRGFVNEGFAGVPESASVKTLTVVSKKKKAEMTKTEGKRSAEDSAEDTQGCAKKAKVDGADASAAPTPARLDAVQA